MNDLEQRDNKAPEEGEQPCPPDLEPDESDAQSVRGGAAPAPGGPNPTPAPAGPIPIPYPNLG